MLKWWWVAGPAAILMAMAALQAYWLRQLHASKAQERESYLQRATFLFAAELDHRLSLVEAQFQEAGADPRRLQGTWHGLKTPELVEAIWLVDPANRDTATKLSVDSLVTLPLDRDLRAWLYGAGALRGFPPLLLGSGTMEETIVAVVWNREYFGQTFLPWCFSRALPRPTDFHYNLINAASGESLLGEADLVADGSSHFYPQTRFASPWRINDPETWDNPRFAPDTAALHFESNGALRLETRLAAGSLGAIERRQRLRDGLPALLSLVFLALAFAAFYTYLRRAKALSQQQAAMMAAFSHELRTPLATIGMAGENLADATIKDEDKVRAYGRLITQESGRLGTMVMQVLQYSKLFGKGIQAHHAHADVAASLAQVERELTLLLEGKRCKLRIECRDTPPSVAIEPEALHTILRNLISNAIKFGPSERTVEIAVVPGVQQRREGLNIHVTDHGFGIPKRERRRVYEQFYRGDRARKDQIQGTGLGLSLVRKLVQNARGRIHHQSDEHRGTTFTVWLPQPQDPIS
ncbi:HAMP domain-containing histidine kinase [Sulfidibacter corallicola]|uniref:histidine kinase n=1 Tax=Sulfidibacter corallicola TaxID=2818388 RepID=A0A8A4TFR2_SULCO|nr:HAMP domain-containing sensor histidine kinase [Sulfidibacter corallicola]QTD48776.1 HAMP domain-containing histidine kinase [Sulfidibacter corallicola]